MPNQEKARTRGRTSTLSQPCPTQGPSSPSTSNNITPTRHRQSLSHNLNDSILENDTVAKLIQKFDHLEETISNNKKSSDALASQTHKELLDIKNILEINRLERQQDRRNLMIVEQKLKIVNEINSRLSDKVNNLENKSKIHNIRLDGKAECEGEDLKQYINDLAMFLNPNSQNGPELTSIYRIGKKSSFANAANGLANGGNRASRPRTIMLTFKIITDRNTFYFARTKLKGSQQYQGIFLNDDVTVETRKAREDYRSVAAIARSGGASVRVHDDGIIIDGTKYKLNEPQMLPQRYSLKNAKTVKLQGEIYFHSEHSYLSNFFNAPIVDNGMTYQNAEQKYQADKCEASGDLDKRDRILLTTTPLEAKRIGDTTTETAEWRVNKEKVMTDIINMKFNQNPELAVLLKKTGDLTLNEATGNSFFGIGATLHSREIKDKSYRGLNKLGKILMEKRQQLQQDAN